MNVKKPGITDVSKIQRPARKASASSRGRHAASFGRTTPTELAKWIKKVHDLPEVRADLVNRVKAEISAGDYETPDKLQIAAERMLEDI